MHCVLFLNLAVELGDQVDGVVCPTQAILGLGLFLVLVAHVELPLEFLHGTALLQVGQTQCLQALDILGVVHKGTLSSQLNLA